jgi:glycine cleavage system aminomethyltransferase T
MSTVAAHPHLHPTVRRSPYFPRTEAAGASDYMVYNWMYMPMAYGRDPREDYRAMVERVTLWDVGAERQCELRGPDAVALADYLSPRRLDDLPVGGCRYTMPLDRHGRVMVEAIALRPFADVVWISHASVDLDLWATGLALARGADVEVSQPDVAPLQLQGPHALDVLAGIADVDVAKLPRFRCVPAKVAGVDVVVSNTGWSKEAGFELYPLGTERALELWDAIVEAGEPHGLLVTGPVIHRAVEQGITDVQYRANSDMDPFEAGWGALLDIDGRDFVGREALLAIRERGPARRTVGLALDGPPVPMMEEFWPVEVDGAPAGVARWVVWSYALERNIAIALVDAAAPDDATFTVRAPDGPRTGSVHPIPFVTQ